MSETKQKSPLTFRCGDDIDKIIKAITDETGDNRSTVIRKALESYFKELKLKL